MPTTTITTYQRDGLYELVRNHLGGIGDVWTALEETEDFETAERLGIEFGEDFRLLHPRPKPPCPRQRAARGRRLRRRLPNSSAHRHP